jgi:hypothetical protein
VNWLRKLFGLDPVEREQAQRESTVLAQRSDATLRRVNRLLGNERVVTAVRNTSRALQAPERR